MLRRVGESKRREAQNEETSLLSYREDDGGKLMLGRMKPLSKKFAACLSLKVCCWTFI